MFLLECCHVSFFGIFVKAWKEDFEVPETNSEENNFENGWERKMILSLPFGLVWGPIFRGELALSIREGRSIGIYIYNINHVMYIYLSLCILCILAMYTHISIYTVIYTYMYVYYKIGIFTYLIPPYNFCFVGFGDLLSLSASHRNRSRSLSQDDTANRSSHKAWVCWTMGGICVCLFWAHWFLFWTPPKMTPFPHTPDI